jgi:hypothetical protein
VEAIQRRAAEEIVGANVYRDKRIDETVNTLTAGEILVLVSKEVGDCAISVFNQYSQGEVRTDSRGEGSLMLPERMEALEDKRAHVDR